MFGDYLGAGDLGVVVEVTRGRPAGLRVGSGVVFYAHPRLGPGGVLLDALVSTNMTVPLNSTWTDPGYAVTDSDGNDLTGSVAVTGAVDTFQAATCLLYYQVVDGSGTPATP